MFAKKMFQLKSSCWEISEMLERKQIFEEIKLILWENFGVEVVSEKNLLVQDFDLDSLSLVEFAMRIEEAFDFDLTQEDEWQFADKIEIGQSIFLKDVVDYVECRLQNPDWDFFGGRPKNGYNSEELLEAACGGLNKESLDDFEANENSTST